MIERVRCAIPVLLVSYLLAMASFAAASDLPTVLPQNVKVVHFPSTSLGDERTLLVMLPLDYDTSVRRYPALYLLHGYDADITGWARGTNLSAYAAHHQLIIITPDASRGWYVNSVSDQKARFDDFIVKDVIGYVDAHFRTIPEPFARAIAGVSMGGFGATFLGLKHHDAFAAIGSFSGALAAAHEKPPELAPDAPETARKSLRDYEALVGKFGSQEHKDRDPFEWAAKIPVEDVPMLFIVCGGEDQNAETTHEFLSVLAKRRIPYEYREISPRGHDWRIWNEEIPVFLDKLDRLEGFGSALPEGRPEHRTP
jgi:putative tributyrin esterase